MTGGTFAAHTLNAFDLWYSHFRKVHEHTLACTHLIDPATALSDALVLRCTGCDWFAWTA